MGRTIVDVVHVGSASRDLAGDDPRGWRLGGGVSYGALTTARIGLRTVAIVGLDDAAADAAELDLLRAAGVAIHAVALDGGPVFDNIQTPTGRVQTVIATGKPISPPDDLPADRRVPRAWSLVPVAGEVDDRWLEGIGPGAVVAVGWQGWLRRLVVGRQVARRAPRATGLIGRADLVGVSTEDLAPGVEPAGLIRFLHAGSRLLLTDGPAGGWMASRDGTGTVGTVPYRAIPSRTAIDPTGAGDVFLAAFLACTLRPDVLGDSTDPAIDSLRFAAAAASLAVEGPGLAGVPDLDAIRARLTTLAGAGSGFEAGSTAERPPSG